MTRPGTEAGSNDWEGHIKRVRGLLKNGKIDRKWACILIGLETATMDDLAELTRASPVPGVDPVDSGIIHTMQGESETARRYYAADVISLCCGVGAD